MNSTLFALACSAVSISFIHTATGPDHYLPFIVLSRSRRWSRIKTILLTTACGFGHVFSSLIIGALGLILGWQLNHFSWFQDLRGNISGWALLLFGLAYLFYGLYQAKKSRPHKHFSVVDGEVYMHQHGHQIKRHLHTDAKSSGHVQHTHLNAAKDHGHDHCHEASKDGGYTQQAVHVHSLGNTVGKEQAHTENNIKVTPYILFMIFVMGPSEPLTPLLFYSGLNRSVAESLALIIPFSLTTVATMLGMVMLGRFGYTNLFSNVKLERYMSAISGAVVAACGFGMVFLGW